MKYQVLLLASIILVAGRFSANANNIQIANVTSVPNTGYVQMQFDLSWENSWRNSANYDAAWIFFKFKDNDGTWRHLNVTGANNVISAGYAIIVAPDFTGVMICRSASGNGNVSLTGVRLGITNLPGNFDIKAFAIEMVEIPFNDQYYLGDGESGTYYSNSAGAPFLVNSSTIVMGTSAGQLDDGIGNGALAAGYPDGYSPFVSTNIYLMKHEISQAAYRDFLNTLTYAQQTTRTAVAPNSAAGTEAIGVIARRNGIQVSVPGNVGTQAPAVYGCNLNNNASYDEATDGEWIACNYLSWMDLCAFLDWAALRPMTEMEFEKACRGPLFPVNAENAAGVVAAAAYSYTISNAGGPNEAVSAYQGSVLQANITYNSTSPGGNSPLRVGIHATAYATRISAGAGYYGALDLSGNIEEFTVTSGNVAGRTYTGVSGDGNLNAAGDADEDFWPGINGNTNTAAVNTTYGGVTGVTGAAGLIGRGGSAGYTGFNLNKVSYRTAPLGTSARTNISGGRGLKVM